MNFTFQKFEITLVIILFEYSKVKVQIAQQNQRKVSSDTDLAFINFESQ